MPIQNSLRYFGYDSLCSDLHFHLESILFPNSIKSFVPLQVKNKILINGDFGTGKHALFQHVSSSLLHPSFIFDFDVSNLCNANANSNDGNQLLQTFISKAALSCPCIIALQNLEILSDKFNNSHDFNIQDIVKILKTQFSRIKSSSLVAIVSFIPDYKHLPKNLLDFNALGDGFNEIFTIELPDHSNRMEIINGFLKQEPMLNISKEAIVESSLMAIGCSAKDIKRCFEKVSTSIYLKQLENSTTAEFNEILTENFKKFYKSTSLKTRFNTIKPSNISWNDIEGHEQVKLRLMRLVDGFYKNKSKYMRLGVKAASGILLHGPSGSGKTMLVHAMANATNMGYISVKPVDIFHKYLGDSEASVREIFKMARRMSPCMVFIDQMDVIGRKRSMNEDNGGVNERVLSQLLNELDGLESIGEVMVVGCTDRLEMLDDALIRCGRLDNLIKVSKE